MRSAESAARFSKGLSSGRRGEDALREIKREIGRGTDDLPHGVILIAPEPPSRPESDVALGLLHNHEEKEIGRDIAGLGKEIGIEMLVNMGR